MTNAETSECVTVSRELAEFPDPRAIETSALQAIDKPMLRERLKKMMGPAKPRAVISASPISPKK
jgi:hypothetical protein